MPKDLPPLPLPTPPSSPDTVSISSLTSSNDSFKTTTSSSPYVDTSKALLWNESQVGQWLTLLNLEQHAAVFEKNNITGPTLLELSKVAIRSMGITKVGDQARIYAGIRSLQKLVNKTKEVKLKRELGLRLDGLMDFPVWVEVVGRSKKTEQGDIYHDLDSADLMKMEKRAWRKRRRVRFASV